MTTMEQLSAVSGHPRQRSFGRLIVRHTSFQVRIQAPWLAISATAAIRGGYLRHRAMLDPRECHASGLSSATARKAAFHQRRRADGPRRALGRVLGGAPRRCGAAGVSTLTARGIRGDAPAGPWQGWQRRSGALNSAPRPAPPSAPGLARADRAKSRPPGHPPDLFCSGLTRGLGWHARESSALPSRICARCTLARMRRAGTRIGTQRHAAR